MEYLERLTSTFFKANLDGAHDLGAAFVERELVIVALAAAAELDEFIVVGGDEAAHNALVADHAGELGFGLGEVGLGGGNFVFNAADIGLDAGNIVAERRPPVRRFRFELFGASRWQREPCAAPSAGKRRAAPERSSS